MGSPTTSSLPSLVTTPASAGPSPLPKKFFFVRLSHRLGALRHRADERKEPQMQARMKNPLFVLPGALDALIAVNKTTEKDSLPQVTRKLVHLRASQINGCSVCVDMHARELKKA